MAERAAGWIEGSPSTSRQSYPVTSADRSMMARKIQAAIPVVSALYLLLSTFDSTNFILPLQAMPICK